MTPDTAARLDLFVPHGVGAHVTSPLLWGLIWLSVAVSGFVGLAVVGGIAVRARRTHDPKRVRVERSGNGLWWIYIGVGVSAVILLVFVGWTVSTMADIVLLPRAGALTIDVSARQWWWDFTYGSSDSNTQVVTANELHIPAGVPVRFLLTSPDVIHSFWVPALGGKTDVIPGRTNEMWLQADKPGIYRGQCSEFCGMEHAQMALLVFVDTPADFDAWRAAQAHPAAPPGGEAVTGETQFIASCGRCHTVRGTAAQGTAGPDLTHLMSRKTLAAGMLDNTLGNLSGWIADPQGIKPGARMPDVGLSGPELQSILTYLRTLT